MQRPAGRTILTGLAWSAGLVPWSTADGMIGPLPPSHPTSSGATIIPEPECPRTVARPVEAGDHLDGARPATEEAGAEHAVPGREHCLGADEPSGAEGPAPLGPASAARRSSATGRGPCRGSARARRGRSRTRMVGCWGHSCPWRRGGAGTARSRPSRSRDCPPSPVPSRAQCPATPARTSTAGATAPSLSSSMTW